jgi:uncharacterized protein
VLETFAEPMARHAIAFGHLLGSADLAVYGAVEVALVGERDRADFRALEREVAAHYIPSLALAGGESTAESVIALLRDRTAIGGAATAYVCRHYACETPVTETDPLGEQIERAVAAPTTAI